MRLKQSIILALSLFLVFPAGIFSQQTAATSFPRIEPDPKAIEYYNLRRSNSIPWLSLAEISLWASGTASNSMSSYIERITSAVTALNSSGELPPYGKERAEFILTYMHVNLLRTYSLYQTRIDTLLTQRTFNCVSSAVLYMILCQSAGINASGVITREHAFITVHINGEDIDVETTNRYGFDPGNRKEFHDQIGRVTGFSYVPAQNYRDRQTIGKIELISLILNNRIADFERSNNFTGAVPLAVDRAVLLLGNSSSGAYNETSNNSLFADPRTDLTDRLLNYGGQLLRSNREEDGLRWALSASSLYPDAERWNTYIQAAVNNRIARFIRDNRFSDARNFLESNKLNITAELYSEFDAVIIDTELSGRANRIAGITDGDAVINEIEQARNNGRITASRAAELITFSVQKTASVLGAAPLRDWRGAISFIENAVRRFGSNRELEQALNIYRSNLASDYHNRFASEWNRRNYDEAERILNEGLSEFPDNRQLISDRETVNRQRARN